MGFDDAELDDAVDGRDEIVDAEQSDGDYPEAALEGDAKEYVDELTESYVKESKADHPEDGIKEKARRLSTSHLLWQKTVVDSFKRGWVLEEEVEYEGETNTTQKLNPALNAEGRINSKDRKFTRKLRVYGTPDRLPWSEQ